MRLDLTGLPTAEAAPAWTGAAFDRPVHASDTAAKALLRQLGRLYGAERLLALELSSLFQRCESLAVRLVLSDQRRATNRQILRLERIIQAKTGAPAASMIPYGRKRRSRRSLTGRPAAPDGTGSLLGFPMLAAEAGMAAYRSAMALARQLGEAANEALLAESWNEKRQMADTLQQLEVTTDRGGLRPAVAR